MGDKSWVGDVDFQERDAEMIEAADTINIFSKGRKTSSFIYMFTLDNFIMLMASKKRGDYPTTMLLKRKDQAIENDVKLFDELGGPFFNSRFFN